MLRSPDAPPAMQELATGALTIGLVNLMPAAARATTAAQFAGLLPASHLRHFTLADVPDLLTNKLDGLIITGAEPAATAMADEPCYPAIAALADWAAANTAGVIFSCLAAHAAVQHLDGLHRHKLPAKLSGVFTCQKATPHPLTAGLPEDFPVPHSRHNTLAEPELLGHGYTILSRAPRLGADAFVKPHGDSLFLFLQGHPEYTPDRLPAEYLRDLRRHRAGQTPTPPAPPENVFDETTLAELAATPDLKRLRPGAAIWRPAATTLFTAWLSHLATAKANRL
jgi:homoserine O-succinyltransferase